MTAFLVLYILNSHSLIVILGGGKARVGNRFAKVLLIEFCMLKIASLWSTLQRWSLETKKEMFLWGPIGVTLQYGQR